ncbi:MAG: hypothetical protein IPL61_36375 [Myxococcales bacterium]|nr:hypothetical protein [Myxococcales bacterium]
MSDSEAALRFYPWVRRGAAAQVTAADAAAGGTRAAVPVALRFNDDPALEGATTLTLVGPGDVTGFDARSISRRSPPDRTLDAEPNYFPAVEFDQADLPWRYTPRAEDATRRLRPWLCLAAFTEAELGAFEPTTSSRALEAVTILAGPPEQPTPMPPADQLWAWAHVQVSGDDGAPLAEVVLGQPSRCLARLLCPRRLAPRTKYHVLLIPTFEVGRRAGLRLALGDAAASLATAWAGAALVEDLRVPIYHRWTFSTGFDGDFETLVRRLTPAPLPATAGSRGLDVATPGGGLPAAAPGPLALGGALRPPDSPAPEAIAPEFVDGIVTLLDLPATVRAEGGTPLVAPPLYGAWHARRETVAEAAAAGWFRELNVDPRGRVAAGMGTEVVQEQQEGLMASAWAQVAGIREANAQLRMAQVARAVGERLHRRHVATADDTRVLELTAPTHGQIKASTATVRARVEGSPARLALVSSGLRRAARPLGPVGRRQGRPDVVRPHVLGRVNAGTLTALAETPPALPRSVPTVGWLEDRIKQTFPSTKDVEAAPPAEKVYAWDPVDGEGPDKWDEGNGEDSPSMAAFREAALALLGRPPTSKDGETLTRLDLPTLGATVAAAIDPRTTIAQALAARMVRAPGFAWSPSDPLAPVMAHPVFPQPMFQPLAARSPDWILPGLFDLPADRVTLAKTNPAFIEAYMVGLNHELARELLWREYPSDQRGSYFRQFWDPAGVEATPVPETSKDVTPLHGWDPASTLGSHSPRPLAPGQEHLVLVIRGEALRRYPGTLVYAQRATRTGDVVGLGIEQLRPVFSGRLPPDVAMFGFALTDVEVRGDGTAANPGWCFVFEEQPGDPRFGLDEGAAGAPPAVTWDDLSWGHLAATPEALAAINYVDLAVDLPARPTGEGASGAGWHLTASAGQPIARGADHAVITLQRAVRVAIHGADLLPTPTPA